MSSNISDELLHLSCKIKDLASRNHNEVRRSARVAEEQERKYEQILERANEAERLRVRNLQLQRELKKHENVLQRAAEADRLERDNLILHDEYRRWKGIAKARMEELNHLNRDK